MKIGKHVALHRNGETRWFHPGDEVPEDWEDYVPDAVLESDDLVDLDELPYRKWNVDELRTEIVNRGLDVSGPKRVLIAALEKDDAAKKE